MPRIKLLAFWAITTLFLTSACMNSEGEYQQVLQEKKSYAESLTSAQEENKILHEAHEKIFQSCEELRGLLKNYDKKMFSASNSDALPNTHDAESITPENIETTGTLWKGHVYVVQSGDTLSNIAAKYRTDMNTLLNLNPTISARSGHVIWLGEKIKVPNESPASGN